MLRWLFTAVLILLALLFWFMTLTVPMVSATAPAMIAILLTFLIWYFWPNRPRKSPVRRTE